MWQAIQYVTSGFTLCAFVVAAIAYVTKVRLRRERDLIKEAPEKDRAALVAKTLEGFDVDTTGLTKQQQYDIAVKQIQARMGRFRVIALVVVVLAGIGALGSIWMFAISRTEVSRNKSSLGGSGADDGPADTLRQYEPFGALRTDEYSEDSSPESEAKARKKVEERLKNYPNNALAQEADEFCRNLTRLASEWTQKEKDDGQDLGKFVGSALQNGFDYSWHFWPEVAALQMELIARTPPGSVERVNIKFSRGESLSTKAVVNKATDVDSVRQYLQALREAFVTSASR